MIKQKYTERRLEEDISFVKKGCGMLLGVPIFKKFKPCGVTYKGELYFCDVCKRRLSLLKTYLFYYKLGIKEAQAK